mgnify:CR=1 FL=1
MDETGGGNLPDRFYADYTFIPRPSDFPGNMLLGLGIMLAANEVPRIAQQFGLDSSVRVNMMSVVHATTTAVNLTRSLARAR